MLTKIYILTWFKKTIDKEGNVRYNCGDIEYYHYPTDLEIEAVIDSNNATYVQIDEGWKKNES